MRQTDRQKQHTKESGRSLLGKGILGEIVFFMLYLERICRSVCLRAVMVKERREERNFRYCKEWSNTCSHVLLILHSLNKDRMFDRCLMREKKEFDRQAGVIELKWEVGVEESLKERKEKVYEFSRFEFSLKKKGSKEMMVHDGQK